MASLREAAEALAELTNKAFSKKSKASSPADIYSMIHDLYHRGGYAPITRIDDLTYSTSILESVGDGERCENLKTMKEWASTRGIKVDLRNPFDAVRVVLDTLFETCLYGTKNDQDIINVEVVGKAIKITYRGLCDLLRGLSEFGATQHTWKYLLHLGDFFREIFTSYTGVEIGSVLDALKAESRTLEKFRVHVTAKLFPTAKAYLTILYLFKYKWPVTEILYEGSSGGIRAKKAVEPTYLGRITSELLDSMMGIYHDDTALHAYDTIVKAYFRVFQAFGKDIERKLEVNYLESHPVMLTYIEELTGLATEVTPQIRNHLNRRGVIRLGEVKHDVKDYLLTLFYLAREGERKGYVPVSSIRSYDIEALLTRNALIRGEAPWWE